jgi:hypothetical protein
MTEDSITTGVVIDKSNEITTLPWFFLPQQNAGGVPRNCMVEIRPHRSASHQMKSMVSAHAFFMEFFFFPRCIGEVRVNRLHRREEALEWHRVCGPAREVF